MPQRRADAHAAGARVAIDTVSVAKASHVATLLSRIDLLFLSSQINRVHLHHRNIE